LNPPVNAVDGNAASRFSTGVAQMTPAIYQIDLGSVVSVDGVKLDSGTDPTDFAQSYQVDVSTNAIAWTPVACGAGATVTDVAFTPVTARYIRVTQNVVNSGSWWSVHELNVYCPTTDTCSSGAGGAGGASGGGAGGTSGAAGTSGGAAGGAGAGGTSGAAGTGGGAAGGAGAGGTGGAAGTGGGGGAGRAPTGGLEACTTVHHH
jgi:hypothetical protein